MLLPAFAALLVVAHPEPAHHDDATHAHAHEPAAVASEPGSESFFRSVVELTHAEEFSRAGEAYFSPDSEWIIFQAVPVAEETGGQPRYSMYVAKVTRDADGRVTGLDRSIRVSAPGSANTCGWFHPTLPGVVLFGSTRTPPAEQVEAGYSRDTSKYSWDFPAEMEVVTRTVREIVEDSVDSPRVRAELLARHDVGEAQPIWERDGYDAEGSWSPDGRFVLYTAVDPKTHDADIFVHDIASGSDIPIVVAPGYDGGPFFSPDGTRICYRSDRKGDNILQLFVAELAFDHRGVPTGMKREIQLTDDGHVNWAPFWHPSGEYLVYATSAVSHRNYEVFAIAASGNNDAANAQTVRVTSAEGFDGLPVFNRDGSLMMWTGQRGEPDAGGKRTSQLYIAEVNGEYPPGMTRPTGHPSGLSTTDPHGSRIADALAGADALTRRYHDHIITLASEWLAGRFPGTRGIEIAEEYISHWFTRAGLTPAFTADSGETSFFQPFTFALHASDRTVTGRNVAAVLRGKGSLADRFIVIGAHHDHLGMGEYGSMTGTHEIHEGADDNASGVAAVLLLAEELSKAYAALPSDADARTIVFVTFSAEELGLNGSRHFAAHPPVDLARCDLMLNFDMIGRITNHRVSISGAGSGDGLGDLVDRAVASYGSSLEVIRPGGLTARSDHAAFYDLKVPVLFCTIDPFHVDYHTPSDEAWKINCEDAARAVVLSQRIVMNVAQTPRTIAFAELAGYDRGPSMSMGKIKVRFGIMPGNYNDTEPGVLVQRVSPGTSAALAGVLPGDRLMTWNGQEITTVTSWMESMAANEPGDVVTVGLIRNGERIELPVELLASKAAGAAEKTGSHHD